MAKYWTDSDGIRHATVEKGDTLTKIAEESDTTVDDIVTNNYITNPDLIYVYQELILNAIATKKKNTANRATIVHFGLQSTTDRTVFATWEWSKDNTENYQTIWYYYADGIWFTGSDTTVELKESIYTAPTNALKVKFKVKPLAKTYEGSSSTYWNADWSTIKEYDFSDNPPEKPNVPTVEIKDFMLRATLGDLKLNATSIHFQVIQDNLTVYKTSDTTIRYPDENDQTGGYATYTCVVAAGHTYKVRCRSARDGLTSDWTDYSSNYSTKPSATAGITTCKATSESSVFLAWDEVENATSYEIEYTTKIDYFDGSSETTTISGILYAHYEITGLESGHEYFFRVRAVNEQGESTWSGIKSVIIGKTPVAPTTWSSTTTGVVGEPLTLYWVHNAEDGSEQTFAEVIWYVDDVEYSKIIQSDTEPEGRKTMYFEIDTSLYDEGAEIKWRVRTAGATRTLGEWSITRTIDIYAPPTLDLRVIELGGNSIEKLESFPFYISGIAGPETQIPLTYNVTITSNDSYETVDSIGNPKFITAGSEVYSKNFDISSSEILVEMSAGNINLENNVTYTVTCVVSMNSGLTAKETSTFTVAWTDEMYEPSAGVGIDYDSLTASIHPFCGDEEGNLIEGVTLSVYRREYDGTFTELATGIDNMSNTCITDPHPALDFARYRIVAVTDATGAVSYYDVPGCPVGEKSIVLQWDETWNSFDVGLEDPMEESNWAGSMLKLPYNVDVSDNNSSDVSLIKYVGRSHPVSYYGTQLGATSTWNTVIEKTDVERLYTLRRLAMWMGDVYVREPSGSGYWANISVSFNQKHLDLTIPITIKITRVEGGV